MRLKKKNIFQDEAYMLRALELARNGAGFVSPNPMVGCVIMKNGKIIGEGYHKKFGGAHAEIEAMGNEKWEMRNEKWGDVKGSTMYVNLEPCCHSNKKTPPCVPAIIASGIKRVVVGMKDPNPLVAGKGIRALRKAGIEVVTSVLVQQCKELNEPFVKWITTGKPFVVLKVALTRNGALTLKKGIASHLTCTESDARVHEMRQLYDAIAMGVGTVMVDDPRLTCRRKWVPTLGSGSRLRAREMGKGKSRNPVRIVFDTHLRIPEDARLLGEKGRTIIFTGQRPNKGKLRRMTDRASMTNGTNSVEIVPVKLGRDKRVSLLACFEWLGAHGIASVLVEGGAEVVRAVMKQKLADKYVFVVTPKIATHSRVQRLWKNENKMTDFFAIELPETRAEMAGSDVWITGYS